MNNKKYFFKELVLTLFFLTTFGNCQYAVANEPDFATLPTSAKSIEAFIPKGWYLENRIDAQLNNDNVLDSILVLIDRSKSAPDATEGNRKLVVLLGKSPNEYVLSSIGHHLLWCYECYGTLGGPGGNFPEIKVNKGVISIYQSGGSTEAVDVTLKFRFEPKSSKFRLIGKDTMVADRPSGNFETISINYLNNQKKIGNVTFDRFGNNEKITDRVEKIKPTMLYLETYNVDDL